MIPLDFFLFYSGSKMSYLRYLTFKTLRHFHPESKIQLFTTKKSQSSGHNWNREKQDFESPIDGKDYMDDLKDLSIEIVVLENFAPQYNAVVQSDIFRYWRLHEVGGFYLDTDQIILNSFKSLPLHKDLICSIYRNPQCGMYAPVGILGSAKGTEIMDYITKNILKYYSPNNYNSSGPFMFIDVLKKFDSKEVEDTTYNAPPSVFYPAYHSNMVNEIYDGSFEIPDASLALHLFMGHPLSQEFNKKYTEEFAKVSQDTVSRFLREKKFI